MLCRSPLTAGSSRLMVRGLSRSTTTCVNLAHFTSPNLSAGTNHPSSQCSSSASSPSVPKKSSPHQTGPRARTPFRTRVTAIIESSGLVRGPQPSKVSQASPPSTAPLAKRVMAPVQPCSSSESVVSQTEQEQLRKTLSLTTISPPHHTENQLNRKSQLEERLSRSGQMSRDYQEKPVVLKLQTKLAESKESSVCSSVLSSMESVESNTSEGEEQE